MNLIIDKNIKIVMFHKYPLIGIFTELKFIIVNIYSPNLLLLLFYS
jgi:hypothetical protein